MTKLSLVMMLMLSLGWLTTSVQASNSLSEDDKQLVAHLELLQSLDMLEHFDLMVNYDLVKQDKLESSKSHEKERKL